MINLMRECTKCGNYKLLTDYYKRNDAYGGYRKNCKACHIDKKKHGESTKRYNKIYPWKKMYSQVKQRCENPKAYAYKHYGGKGIRCLLSVDDIVFLRLRDKADFMVQPCIHRRDSEKDYTVRNCCITERKEHAKFHAKERWSKWKGLSRPERKL